MLVLKKIFVIFQSKPKKANPKKKAKKNSSDDESDFEFRGSPPPVAAKSNARAKTAKTYRELDSGSDSD